MVTFQPAVLCRPTAYAIWVFGAELTCGDQSNIKNSARVVTKFNTNFSFTPNSPFFRAFLREIRLHVNCA
jgi:hypothetical protein